MNTEYLWLAFGLVYTLGLATSAGILELLDRYEREGYFVNLMLLLLVMYFVIVQIALTLGKR